MDLNDFAPVEYPRHHSIITEPSIHSSGFDTTTQPHLDPHTESPAQQLQLITSLVDSLSALATAAPGSQEDNTAIENRTPISIATAAPAPAPSAKCPDVEEVGRDLHDPRVADDSSDGEVATAPVIPYARRPPILSKSSSKSRFYMRNMSQQPLAPRDSIQSLRSGAESDSVGIPSVERRHLSSASSTLSVLSGLSGSLRKPTAESLRDKALSRPVPPQRFSSDRRRKTESLYSTDQEKENRYPTRASSTDGYSPSSVQLEQANVEHSTGVSLARLSRSELGDHLIPSRRSSLRRSATGLSEASQGSSRHSMAGRNLTDLNIDSELIDGDHSTVRRIRELQEAKEKRQKEWRNEAKKADRAAKRHTIATPKVSRRSSPYPNSRLSVTDVVHESSEVEAPPEVSACVTGADLAKMPALVPEVFDSMPAGQGTDLAAGPSIPTRLLPSRANSVGQSSTSQPRRKSSRRDPSAAELKSISDEVDTFLGAPRFTQKIRHPRTGRTIAFSEVGDPRGFVVFCCVGMGLTRYLTAFYDELARTLRLRLIAPDRPGVGESSAAPESACTPLNWVDDVAVICSSLGITRFSLLAHSAGAIYAMAVALKMPQYVRGRIHLLAPWIPPSQMPKGALLRQDSQPVANLPLSHKILSVLPPQILKVANSRFLTATSASVDARPLKSVKRSKQLQGLEMPLAYSFTDMDEDGPFGNASHDVGPEHPQMATPDRGPDRLGYRTNSYFSEVDGTPTGTPNPRARRQTPQLITDKGQGSPAPSRLTSEARQALFDQALTHRIWALATQNANPAIDLVVCLERRKAIGFRYPEVTRSVVIHHGVRDTRVPLDNVRWLQSVMKRCELRVLDGEGHGLMASASAMASVLGEIAKEWEEWEKIARGKDKKKMEDASSRSTKGRS
ncbi:hypothetical protein A1O1_06589 [Capronia coronata CBS 617.96]|uniref:AB hydrolase-1 domain-containing protein n=1 Tax=Capronia coronata CBS 617.96 TaxID=1182541 RepID=W9YVB1_9EURO|nr:uncharacterized protein A1O1_06589 [Capronia coronata CBS 617.96]EXJ86219.1 hypothetical protein A1O1_06589 [Capronia coronata CBS 617.96]